jgi:hypothetical protein
MRLLNFTAASLLVLAGCSQANVQPTGFMTTDTDGRIIYHMNGFTNNGELAANSGRKYMEGVMEEECPTGFKIMRFNEVPAHNAIADFLYWNGEGKCTGPSLGILQGGKAKPKDAPR